MRIAIQPDFVIQPNGERQSFSKRWVHLAEEQNIEAQLVDVHAHDVVDQIRGCDGFMWRYGYGAQSRRFAQLLLPSVELGLGIKVFPDWRTSWTFEDKVAQRYLLDCAGIPTPETWIFWRTADALQFAETAAYPLVIKLSNGIRSDNVALVRSPQEAVSWIHRLFGRGVDSLEPNRLRQPRTLVKSTAKMLLGRKSPRPHYNYFLAQEFLPDNDCDTRVTIIGRRAFAFRRFNRAGDFRASGSGKIDWDPGKVDLPTVQLAYLTAKKLGTQSIAIDALRRGDERLICEVSYTYASWAIHACPGHWEFVGDSENVDMRWIDGQMRAEDAIFEDFIASMKFAGVGGLGARPG